MSLMQDMQRPRYQDIWTGDFARTLRRPLSSRSRKICGETPRYCYNTNIPRLRYQSQASAATAVEPQGSHEPFEAESASAGPCSSSKLHTNLLHRVLLLVSVITTISTNRQDAQLACARIMRSRPVRYAKEPLCPQHAQQTVGPRCLRQASQDFHRRPVDSWWHVKITERQCVLWPGAVQEKCRRWKCSRSAVPPAVFFRNSKDKVMRRRLVRWEAAGYAVS